MKNIFLILLATMFISCAYQQPYYRQSYGQSYNQCIPPTYNNAVKNVGIARGILGIIDAGMHGHLHSRNNQLNDQMIRQSMHDLRVQYQICQQQQILRQQQQLRQQQLRQQQTIPRFINL